MMCSPSEINLAGPRLSSIAATWLQQVRFSHAPNRLLSMRASAAHAHEPLATIFYSLCCLCRNGKRDVILLNWEGENWNGGKR